jgi:hypothetical protein
VQSQFSSLYKISIDKDTDEEIATLTSNFFSPGYLWPSFGFMYAIEDKLNVSFLPLTGKFTIVLDDSLSNAGAYGVEKGQHFRPENGFGIECKPETGGDENISVESELNVFSSMRISF